MGDLDDIGKYPLEVSPFLHLVHQVLDLLQGRGMFGLSSLSELLEQHPEALYLLVLALYHDAVPPGDDPCLGELPGDQAEVPIVLAQNPEGHLGAPKVNLKGHRYPPSPPR